MHKYAGAMWIDDDNERWVWHSMARPFDVNDWVAEVIRLNRDIGRGPIRWLFLTALHAGGRVYEMLDWDAKAQTLRSEKAL